METIKRKIAALKEDVETKDELISDLQIQLKNEKLEREKSENEASSYKRKVIIRCFREWFAIALTIHLTDYSTGNSEFTTQETFKAYFQNFRFNCSRITSTVGTKTFQDSIMSSKRLKKSVMSSSTVCPPFKTRRQISLRRQTIRYVVFI